MALLLPCVGRAEGLYATALERTITDMCGRQVQVPQQVKRVVTAGGTPAVNALLFALGKGDMIVNGLPLVMRSRWKWQSVFAPQLATAPPVSSMGPAWVPDLESLQMLPCDIVFVDSRTTAEMLAARGFTAVCLSWHDPEAILKSIALLGNVMDCPQQAADYHAYFQDVIQRVTNHLAALPADKRHSALYLRVSPLGVPMVATNRYLTQKAGGIYACLEDLPLDHPNISIEQLLLWDPDVLLVWSAKEAQELLSDSRFQNLRAIKQRAVAVVPFGAHAWTHATPEQALGILWLAKRLYPERFSDIDMVHEAQMFYKRFFMKELNEDQIREILQGQPATRS
jgi:iron complex transport system substrate-binding protein